MSIERDISKAHDEEARHRIAARLDEIEKAVADLKTPLSFADQLYVLRDPVAMVRRRLSETPPAA
jgi:hypothetical protein